MKPYYEDDQARLFHGDCREVLPELARERVPSTEFVDLIVADPPYGETSLAWDSWPDGWVAAVTELSSSMWCFGSFRSFLEHRDELMEAWNLSQDVVWEKHNGSGFAADRFKRVHEFALHWYRGPWIWIYHQVPRVASKGLHHGGGSGVAHRAKPTHTGDIKSVGWTDDGTRLARSVIYQRSMHHSAIHPTEKPVGLLAPLIEYGCPPGGLVLDPFAGSGSTLEAARLSGRRAIGIEADEKYCEVTANRMASIAAQPSLFEGAS